MNKPKVYWTKKDGTQIDIDEMDIDHLKNALKMIVRNKTCDEQVLKASFNQKSNQKYRALDSDWNPIGLD